MKIEPAYVTFEQAKLLKEKGFTKENGCACREGWINYLFYFEGKTSEPENDSGYALDTLGNSHLIERPEQWQVVEWLRVKHGIILFALPDNEEDFIDTQKVLYTPVVYRATKGLYNLYKELLRDKEDKSINYFNSPQEAYSAAFDYILTNNLI
jgi:hypothetical protein